MSTVAVSMSAAPPVTSSSTTYNYEEEMCGVDTFLGTSIKLEESAAGCYGLLDEGCPVEDFASYSPVVVPTNRNIKLEMLVNSNERQLDNHGSLQSTPSSSSSSEAAQVDIYREVLDQKSLDLILRHLIQDITSTCAKLDLPTDPNLWTSVDCSKWVEEMCLQFQLPPPQLQLRGGGPALLAMSVEDFCGCVPDGGDTVHAQLQLWKTAFESYNGMKTRSLNASQQPQTDHFAAVSDASQLQTPRSAAAGGACSSVCNGWITPLSPSSSQRFSSNPSSAPSLSSYYSTNLGNSYGFLQPHSLTATSARNSSSSCCSSSLSSSHALQHVLPSPSESGMSSSNSSCISAQDLTDDEYCNEMQFFSPSCLQQHPFPGNFATPQQPVSQHHRQQQALHHQQNSVQSSNDDGKLPCKPIGGPYPRSGCGGSSGTVHLWHFIRELLDQPKQYSSCVRWVDRQEGLFKIESSHHLARFWGLRKNRSQMNYDKLSRSLRQYYKKGIIQKPEKKQRLVGYL